MLSFPISFPQGRWWSAVKQQVTKGPKATQAFKVSSDVVLKKINETQKDSAENEFRIASRVSAAGGHKCAARRLLPYCVNASLLQIPRDRAISAFNPFGFM